MHWQPFWDQSIDFGPALAQKTDKTLSKLAVSLGGEGVDILATVDGIRPICKAVRQEVIKRKGMRSQETHKRRAKKLGSKRVSTSFLPKHLDDTGRSWGQIVEQEGAASFDKLAAAWNAKNGIWPVFPLSHERAHTLTASCVLSSVRHAHPAYFSCVRKTLVACNVWASINFLL